MKRLVTMFGLLAVFSAASPKCWAAIKSFDGGGVNAGNFLTGTNWNDDLVPGPADRAIINDSFVVSYGAGVTTTVRSLFVGADWPTLGDFGTPGTLNMSAGKLIVTGGGDNFQIGRACCAGDGEMNMTGAAILEIGGSDPIIGTSENGVLDVGGTAMVIPTTVGGVYWRIGNYGPSIDAGLQGNGLLNVHDSGSFSAHAIFIGDNDSTGELRVSDNGSVILTNSLVARPSGFQAMGSASVRMTGSNATLEAHNLESESLPGEIPTEYRFDADAGGVSKITVMDAINISNNKLTVDLSSFVLAPGSSLTLFDAAPQRIFGAFAEVDVLGVANPANYAVVYQGGAGESGDVLLVNMQEPILGDFNGDLAVDLADYLILSTNLFTDVSGLTPAQAYLRGDVTSDLLINANDLRGFRFYFDDANGLGAFVALQAALPEPSTAFLAAFGIATLWRRRPPSSRRP